jgi:hypothetical protein
MNHTGESCEDVSCTEMTQMDEINNSINGENVLSRGVNTVSAVHRTPCMKRLIEPCNVKSILLLMLRQPQIFIQILIKILKFISFVFLNIFACFHQTLRLLSWADCREKTAQTKATASHTRILPTQKLYAPIDISVHQTFSCHLGSMSIFGLATNLFLPQIHYDFIL